MHDYEVVSLYIDNLNASVFIRLKDTYGSKLKMTINKFSNLNISHKEPWGKGSYIVSSDLQEQDGSVIILIELNSGDIIAVESLGESTINFELS